MKVIRIYWHPPFRVEDLPDDDVCLTFTTESGGVSIYLSKNQVAHLKRCKNGIITFRTKMEAEKLGTFRARVTITVEDGMIHPDKIGWVEL